MDKYREKYLIYKKKYINYMNTYQIGGGEENKSLLPEWVSNFTGYNLSALKLVSDEIHKHEDQKVQESVQQPNVQQQQPNVQQQQPNVQQQQPTVQQQQPTVQQQQPVSKMIKSLFFSNILGPLYNKNKIKNNNIRQKIKDFKKTTQHIVIKTQNYTLLFIELELTEDENEYLVNLMYDSYLKKNKGNIYQETYYKTLMYHQNLKNIPQPYLHYITNNYELVSVWDNKDIQSKFYRIALPADAIEILTYYGITEIDITNYSLTPPFPQTSIKKEKLNDSTFRKALKNYNSPDIIKRFGIISDWDTSEVTDMSDLHSHIKDKKTFNRDISLWNTSNVITMYGAFAQLESFSQDLRTKKVITMLGNYTAWDVSKVEDFRLMFHKATNFKEDISNWNFDGILPLNNNYSTMFDNSGMSIYVPTRYFISLQQVHLNIGDKVDYTENHKKTLENSPPEKIPRWGIITNIYNEKDKSKISYKVSWVSSEKLGYKWEVNEQPKNLLLRTRKYLWSKKYWYLINPLRFSIGSANINVINNDIEDVYELNLSTSEFENLLKESMQKLFNEENSLEVKEYYYKLEDLDKIYEKIPYPEYDYINNKLKEIKLQDEFQYKAMLSQDSVDLLKKYGVQPDPVISSNFNKEIIKNKLDITEKDDIINIPIKEDLSKLIPLSPEVELGFGGMLPSINDNCYKKIIVADKKNKDLVSSYELYNSQVKINKNSIERSMGIGGDLKYEKIFITNEYRNTLFYETYTISKAYSSVPKEFTLKYRENIVYYYRNMDSQLEEKVKNTIGKKYEKSNLVSFTIQNIDIYNLFFVNENGLLVDCDKSTSEDIQLTDTPVPKSTSDEGSLVISENDLYESDEEDDDIFQKEFKFNFKVGDIVTMISNGKSGKITGAELSASDGKKYYTIEEQEHPYQIFIAIEEDDVKEYKSEDESIELTETPSQPDVQPEIQPEIQPESESMDLTETPSQPEVQPDIQTDGQPEDKSLELTETPSQPIPETENKYKFAFDDIPFENLSLESKPKFTIYTPEGETFTNNPIMIEKTDAKPITREIYDLVQNNNSFIIGNGGAGASGFIKHMANIWNKDWNNMGTNSTLYLIWRGSHSFQNFENMDTIDAAITYEPHWEKRLEVEDKIENLNHFFLSTSELVLAPKDPFGLQKEKEKDGVFLLFNIVLKCFLVDIIDSYIKDGSTNSESRFNIYFVSRYNHSAMGEMDHFMFFQVIEFLVDYIMGKKPSEEFYSLCDTYLNEIKELEKENNNLGIYSILERKKVELEDADYLKMFINQYNLENLTQDQIETVLYKEWMNHVEQNVYEFPWDIANKINENKDGRYNFAYHINDIAFLYRTDMYKRIISDTSTEDYRHPLQNPAQLWTKKGIFDDKEDSPQAKFLKSIKDTPNIYLENWYPNEQIEQKMKSNMIDKGIYKTESKSFQDIFNNYMHKVEMIESNDTINNTWIWHRPAQEPVYKFSEKLSEYYE